MSQRAGTMPESTRPRRRTSFFQHELAPVVTAGIVAALLTAVLIREPARVDQLTVSNPTAYELTVEARGTADQAWMPVTIVDAGATVAAGRRIDQGATWTFRVTGQGRDGGTFEVSRDELRDAGWRLAIPAAVGERLDAGAPAAP